MVKVCLVYFKSITISRLRIIEYEKAAATIKALFNNEFIFPGAQEKVDIFK